MEQRELNLYAKRGEEQDGVDIFEPLCLKPIRAVQCKHHAWPNSRVADTIEKMGSQTKGDSVKVVIQLTKDEEVKALPILLRHSPGTVLQNRTYVVNTAAATELRQSGIQFTELS